MKTLLATLVGIGMLAGTANAQYIRIIPSYSISPEICAPDVIHQSQHTIINPRVAVAPQAPADAPAEEAPAEAAPEAPAPEAPQVPK